MERSVAGDVTGTVGVKQRGDVRRPCDHQTEAGPQSQEGSREGAVLLAWPSWRSQGKGGGGQREILGTERLPGCCGCRLTQAGEQGKKVGDRRQSRTSPLLA